MKRVFSYLIALMMVFACSCGSAFAVETPDTRASLTLSFYNIDLVEGDSEGVISIDYDVQSSKLTNSIGIECVKIYKSNGNYVTTITGTTRNGLIRSQSDIHKGYYDYTLTSGVSYYAEVTVFARVGSEYDSRTVTTSTVTAP